MQSKIKTLILASMMSTSYVMAEPNIPFAPVLMGEGGHPHEEVAEDVAHNALEQGATLQQAAKAAANSAAAQAHDDALKHGATPDQAEQEAEIIAQKIKAGTAAAEAAHADALDHGATTEEAEHAAEVAGQTAAAQKEALLRGVPHKHAITVANAAATAAHENEMKKYDGRPPRGADNSYPQNNRPPMMGRGFVGY